MNEKHTKHLISSYPKLYKHRKYFECDDGWFKLIDELSASLEALITSEDIYATQVKEKWGKLRFYMSYFTDEMDALISIAEHKSASICESCGEEGYIRNSFWVRVLCDSCA